MDDSSVPVECPDNLEEMMEAWTSSTEETIGWRLLCNSAIHTAKDLIPGTDTHDCAASRALEEKILKETKSGKGIDTPALYIDGIYIGGSSEPVTIDQHRSTRCAGIPAEPGTYVITLASGDEPRFLSESTGGWFKDQNPSYSAEVVERNWVWL